MKTFETPRTYGEVIGITVDMQNDFVRPDGRLAVTDAEEAIPAVNTVNEFVREKGGQVIFTQDWHREDNEAHFAKWPVHCVQERAGAAIHNDVEVFAHDSIAKKGMDLEDDGYSGWGAELQAGVLFSLVENLPPAERTVGRAIGMIARISAERGQSLAVIIEGVATDFCVEATTLSALEEINRGNVDVFVVTDGVRAVDLKPGEGEAALAKMFAAGAHPITSQEIINGSIVIDRTRIER